MEEYQLVFRFPNVKPFLKKNRSHFINYQHGMTAKHLNSYTYRKDV